MKSFLVHLRRHPMPKILDDECLGELAAVEAQYVDYIMNIKESGIHGVTSLWYEIDYAEFRKANETRQKLTVCWNDCRKARVLGKSAQ